MIAYRVRINGDLVATVGQEDMSILTATLVTSRGNQDRDVDDYIHINLGGLSHETEKGYCEHFRWVAPEIGLGDTVEFSIIETGEVDPPKKRFRSDHQVQEDPFTEEEARELRYQDYLALKEEFGSSNER